MSKEFLILNENAQIIHGITENREIFKAISKLSLQEQRLFLLLCSQVKQEDDDFKEYKIKANEVAHFFGKAPHSMYKYLPKITDKLMSRYFHITLDNETTDVVHYVKKANYANKNGSSYVYLQISEEMKPYLLKVKQFVSFNLLYTLNFSSSNSLPIYELLKFEFDKLNYSIKKFNNKYEIKYDLENFKDIIGVETKSSATYSNFKQRVLLPSLEEINVYTDIKVEFEEIKDKRKIIGLKFNITKNEDTKNELSELQKFLLDKGLATKGE